MQNRSTLFALLSASFLTSRRVLSVLCSKLAHRPCAFAVTLARDQFGRLCYDCVTPDTLSNLNTKHAIFAEVRIGFDTAYAYVQCRSLEELVLTSSAFDTNIFTRNAVGERVNLWKTETLLAVGLKRYSPSHC